MVRSSKRKLSAAGVLEPGHPLPPVLYHGTSKGAAYAIFKQGFSLQLLQNGREYGNGVYLTPSIQYAADWGDCVIECRVSPPPRILWVNGGEKPDVDAVVRRYGREVLRVGDAFGRAVKPNKTLSRAEVTTLTQAWYAERWRLIERFRRQDEGCSEPRKTDARTAPSVVSQYRTAWQVGALFREIRRRGFDAICDLQHPDDRALVVFNVAHVRPVRAIPVLSGSSGVYRLGTPIDVETLREHHVRFLEETEEFISHFAEPLTGETKIRVEERRRWIAQQRHWLENGSLRQGTKARSAGR